MIVEPILIGLDIGNTSLKAVAFTTSGRVVARVSQSTRPLKSANIRVHGLHFKGLMDPKGLADAAVSLLALVREGVERTGASRDAIRGVAVTGMGGPMVALDSRNKPIYPVVDLWPVDVRDTPLDEADPSFYSTTGYHQHNSPFVTMAWLAQCDPARFASVASILPVITWVGLVLTGTAIADPSTASGTGIWDQRHGTWAKDIIQSTAVPLSCFPPVQPAGTTLGMLRSDLRELAGLPATVTVAIGGHDYLCAAGALGITQPGTVLNMLGTFEIFATPRLSGPVAQTDLDLIHDTHVYPETHALMFQVIGGGHLEWLRRMLTGGLDEPLSIAQWSRILERAEMLRDEDMVDLVFAPFLFGRFFPERCVHPHGALLGLSERHGPEHLARAMIDALSYIGMEALNTLQAVSNEAISKIVLTGGGIQNHLWVQRKADFLQKTLYVPTIADTSSLGAAMLAGMSIGIYKSWDEAAATVDIDWQEIAPQAPIHPQYLDQFVRWDDVSPNACAHTVDLSRRIAQELFDRSNAEPTPPRQ